MKNMKYLNWILAGILALTCSCSDWLDVNPRTEIKETDVYASEKSFKSVMNGIYIQLAAKELYGVNMSCYFPDLLAQLWTPNAQSTEQYVAAFDYTQRDVEKMVQDIWDKYYTCLAHVNNILTNIDQTDLQFTYGNKELIKGEAYGLRAFIHLEVLRLFGPVPKGATDDMVAVPYVDELTKDPSKLVSVSYGEVKKRILQDLDSAAVYLKNDPFTQGTVFDFTHPAHTLSVYKPLDDWHYYRQSHFNLYAVDATRARFYQWTDDPQQAVVYARKVLEVKNPNQSDKFVLANEASYSDSHSYNLVMQCEHLFAVHCSNHQTMIERILAGKPALYTSTTNLSKIYENATDDIRYKAGRYWNIDGKTAYFLKYTGSGSIDPINMIPLIRLSEMYLILIENLKLTEAQTYFETYRQSRGMSVNVGIGTDAERMKRVEAEYRKEFYGEGQMFFYYKRHNTSSYTVPVRFTVPADGYVVPKPKGQIAFE